MSGTVFKPIPGLPTKAGTLMDGLNPPPYRQPSTAVTTPILSYHLTDHLGSITVSTDEKGNITELSDYYPYGSIRADEKGGSSSLQGSSKEQRKYIGQEFDVSTQLSYLNARYYDGGRGQFLSQDPEFWTTSQAWLVDPQNQNSYSYARNNPINLSDPSGKSIETGLEGATSPFEYAFNHPFQTAGIMLVAGGATIVAPVAVAIAGAGLGGYALGNAVVSAYNAPDADTRDYYIGQAVTATALTALGIKGTGTLNRPASVESKATQLNKQAISRAASHAEARGHYPGLSVSEIKNLAKETRANADIKVNISGHSAKQY